VRTLPAPHVIYDPTLPSKRLIFAGVSGDVSYTTNSADGGRLYVLALFNLTSKDSMKPVWRGYCRGRAANLEDLRSRLFSGTCSRPWTFRRSLA